MKKTILLFLAISCFGANAQIKILFDATKAQTAGNADWVIDADAHNIGFPSGPAAVGSGSESNPQRIPTPLQSNITASTAETYWNGALSNWAIDCVKQSYVVETLPFNGQITFGVATNVQDLSNYKIFVVDEPNISYTATEKTAIINFVKSGGGLCIISDHTISDRNNDGVDSPQVLNDLMSNNSVQNNPFGISFDYANISQTTSNVAALASNPILHGSAGNVTQAQWSNGTTMTLNLSQNSTATGLIYKTGSATTGLTNVMCASAVYQSGKVVAIGDSSIADDGTGDSGDTLYNGYIVDANGNHKILLMNAINWLATTTLGIENNEFDKNYFSIAPNPIQNNELKFRVLDSENQEFDLTILDSLGRIILSKNNINLDKNENSIALNDLNSGLYFCKLSNKNYSKTIRFVVK